jgi:acyl-[acyl-carrier-protein]-phospholipid O-acyltransferase/long-chain-fatty-acid--[acyl-carrier-protein] ligase
MRGVLRLLFQVLFRIKVTGDLTVFVRADHLLIVSRLRSRFDALLLGLFLPQSPVVIMPTGEARRGLMRWMLRCVAHHAIDMGDPAAVKRLMKLLRAGARVALFPEGRLARDDAVMKIYPVPALVAVRSGATVLPVTVERPEPWQGREGWSGLLARIFSSVTIRVLTPTRIEGIAGGSARRRRAHATRRLTAVMQSLALESCVPKPLFECFLDACARHGRRAVLVEDARGERQTYGQLLRASLALARLLRRFTSEREIVAVLLPNVAATVAVVLGLSAARRVPAMLNYTSGPRGMEVARTAACVRTVITSRQFVEQARLQPLLEALAGCNIIYLEDARGEFRALDKLWLLAFALRFPRLAAAGQSVRDPAVVLFTSGSEGRPKGVVLSHQAVIANVAQIRVVLPFTPADKILNPLPLYHAYSFTAGMILPLVTGTRLYLHISPLHYRAIPEIVYRRDCTVLFGTSTLLSYYASNANAMDFVRLRYVISGGEKLSPEVARLWMEKFGLRIFDGYGCTECAPVIALATPAFYRSGAVGAFLPEVEYRLEQVSGIETGRLLHVRGPNLMLGYLLADQPGVLQPPRPDIGAGWYNTGDVVDVDEDGIVTISGRARRFAKIAGEMVSLDQIEEVACHASPHHHHAAVLSMEETGGESTVLFTTDPALDRVVLQRAARQLGTQDLAVARRVVHVSELPLLGNGKTDYVTLRQVADRVSPDVTSP